CASARDTQRRESAGSRSWAKLQKAQRALQALVMEKWHTPGPPSHRVSRAILTTERGLEAALRIAPLPSHADHARQAGGRSRYGEVAGTVLARSQSQSDPGAPSTVNMTFPPTQEGARNGTAKRTGSPRGIREQPADAGGGVRGKPTAT